MQSEYPKYIDERQCSAITGLALSTLRNWRFHRRGYSYVKYGRSVRYLMSDVIREMESHRINTGEDTR